MLFPETAVTTPVPGERELRNELLVAPMTVASSFLFDFVVACSHRTFDAPLASFSKQVEAVIALVAGRFCV
jgi:hypothetical protein